MNKNILLACRDAVIGYDNTVAVNGVSFELERGDYLCIVGENGSGKSTLLKGILGLIPMRGGSVDFADGLRRTDIGYLPQQTQAQRDFPATVREVVLSGCLNGSKGPFYSRADRSLANKNMEKLSITNIANRSYRELSGGQQQRVLLARALCAAKELLLLDEPVTGLDPPDKKAQSGFGYSRYHGLARYRVRRREREQDSASRLARSRIFRHDRGLFKERRRTAFCGEGEKRCLNLSPRCFLIHSCAAP